MNIFKKILFVLIGIGILYSCEDENDVIPYAYVNESISLTRYPQLIVNNHVIINGGLNGIILYRLNLDEFLAYDRTCTYHPETNFKVEIESQGSVIAKCPECGSEFDITSGAPTKGPAKYALKQYNAQYLPSNGRIYITN